MYALDQRTTSLTFDSEQRWVAWRLLEEFVASCRYHNSSKKRPGQMPHCEQSPSYSLHEDEALVRYLGVLWSGGGGEPGPFISLTHTMLIKYACDSKQSRHPNILDTQAWNLTFQRERSNSRTFIALSFGNNLELSPLTLAERRYPRALSGQRWLWKVQSIRSESRG